MKKDTPIYATADLHIRDSKPACWDTLEHFMDHQTDMLEQIKKMVGDRVLLVAGDLFHSAQPSIECLSYAISHLPENVFAIPGQHDLLNHNYETRLNETGFGLLEKMGRIRSVDTPRGISFDDYQITGTPWRMDDNVALSSDNFCIHLRHKYIWKNGESTPKQLQADSTHISEICLTEKEKGLRFDLVIYGDNHEWFFGQNVINCGAPTIQNCDRRHVQLGIWKITTKQWTHQLLEPTLKGLRDTNEEPSVLSSGIDEAVEKLIMSAKQQKIIIDTDFLHKLEDFIVKERVKKEVAETIRKICKEFET